MSESRKPPLKEIPEVVENPQNKRRYLRGRFLGKGGFARCYELTDFQSKQCFAGKIVSKTLLIKKHQKDKMTQEIAIHRNLSHLHVVRLDGFFEDIDNVYVLLELCPRRSLMELHKRRRAVTEPEARYFVYQVVDACKYLHANRVIHRDLKLGNLFLNDDMQIKVGDFGLATKLEFDGERKKTLCGTPNYIAPEMLGKKGHSFEVDIWAIGCILFTLLVGKPPFETHTLKDTYQRIKKNEYHVPSRIGPHASHLVNRLLAADPESRPNIIEIFTFDFFVQGYMPSRLPTSCLTMTPKFPSLTQLRSGTEEVRPALYERNRAEPVLSPKEKARKDIMAAPVRPLNTVPESSVLPQTVGTADAKTGEMGVVPIDYFLSDLYKLLTQTVNSRPTERTPLQPDESEDPASMPIFWVSKWVDYSDKYGLGYELCDNSVGVLFNDSTKLILDAAGKQVQYTERDNTEHYYTIGNYPDEHEKKMTLLHYFCSYMNEHLLKAGANMAPREGDELARLPCLRTWFRTRSAIVLHMTNGTLQINFFQDHAKLIVCPLMGAVTYIDENRQFTTYKMSLIEQYGCSKDLYVRIRYARTMVDRLLTKSSSTRPGSLSTVTRPSRSVVSGPLPTIDGSQATTRATPLMSGN